MASRKGGGPDPSVPGKNDPPRRARRSSRASGLEFEKKTVPSRRLEQLRDECRTLETILVDAQSAEAWTATVQAAGKLAELRHRAHALEQSARIAALVDPVERVEAMLEQATADGSWGPAAALARQLDDLRRQAEADAAAAEERARQDAGVTGDKLYEVLINIRNHAPAAFERLMARLAGAEAAAH